MIAPRHWQDTGTACKRRFLSDCLHVIAAVAALLTLAITTGPVAAYDGEFFRVCRLNPYGDNYLSLRTCPSTRCREIFRMGPGTEVVTINPWPRRGWRLIEILPGQPGEGLTGWAFGRYLCPVPVE